MVQGGRWEGDSGWGTRVHLWWMHVDVWQNQFKKIITTTTKSYQERIFKILLILIMAL